ncbi:MAG: tetratricopeptide repeat protein [Deltaproteobacteria bacterium]|jgi:tetratricopeptide (TPR) repeat protein|nr:tetratricopeptide repeat protein [Deltaproteobacteria bacterium]
MGLLNLFKGKSPQELEASGDSRAQFGAWGQAKIEYEKALDKLGRASSKSPEDVTRLREDAQRLEDKILNAKEKLALDHKKTAEEMLEAEYYEDALQYINLALELTADAQLTEELETRSRELKKTINRGIQQEFAEFKVFDDHTDDDKEVSEETPPADTTAAPQAALRHDDDYFRALIGNMPDEVQDEYLSYGDDFKAGYAAMNQGDFEQAAACLSKAMADAPQPDSYIPLELATAYLNLDKFAEARKLLEQFLKHHPEALPAYQMLCELFWESQEYDAAENLLSSVPEELSESVAVYLLRGENLYQSQRFPEAKQYYQEFLKNFGWNEPVARSLAKTHEALNEMANARKIYHEIMDQCRSCHARIDPFIQQKYADLCFSAGLFTTEVLEIYLSLAQQDPNKAAEFYTKISQIYASQGNKEEARRFELFAEKYQQ